MLGAIVGPSFAGRRLLASNISVMTSPPSSAAASAAANAACQLFASHQQFSNSANGIVDALIIGGGPIGLSTAYHLADRNKNGSAIAIIERDPTYARSSATLSAGGIRQQFSLKENVLMR